MFMIDFERELENEEPQMLIQECKVCKGSGGWDIADDPEVYTEWKECSECQGEGLIYIDTL